MAQKVQSNAIRIYPMSARSSSTSQWWNNFVNEKNLSTITKQLLAGECNGFTITSNSNLFTINNSEQTLTEYFEFNIYGYYVQVKTKAIENSINGIKDDSGEGDYFEDFVWFTVEEENEKYIVYANIAIQSFDIPNKPDVLSGEDNLASDMDDKTASISLPILNCSYDDETYSITSVYDNSHLQLVNLSEVNISGSNGTLTITPNTISQSEGELTIDANLTINGDVEITKNLTTGSLEAQDVKVQGELYVRKDVYKTDGDGNPITDEDGESVFDYSTITNTVGNSINPIYMNNGTFIASNATVGGDASPIYMNNGVFTKSNNIYAGEYIRIGSGASVADGCENAIAIGYQATVSGENAIAIGQGAKATYKNSIAIGVGVETTSAEQIRLGTQTVGNDITPIYLNNGVFTVTNIPLVSSNNDGYMSVEDKERLDEMWLTFCCISFESTSFENISDVVAMKYAPSVWSIGDTKKITLTDGDTYDIQIVSFNYEEDNSMTLMFKDLYKTSYPMNNTATPQNFFWDDSSLCQVLSNEIYPIFPSELKDIMKTVRKRCPLITDDTDNNYTTTTIRNVYTNLFIPSMEEVVDTSGSVKPYDFYKDAGSDSVDIRIKTLNGKPSYWWTRSNYQIRLNGEIYSSLNASGAIDDTGLFRWLDATMSYGVAPCFVV